MSRSMKKRFQTLRRKIEGLREKSSYEFTMGETLEKKNNIVPLNEWHRRILAELDFCLQMKEYGDVDVMEAVEGALAVLEKAQTKDGVLTNLACEQAEQCLLPLAKEARTYTLLLVGHAHLDMNWMWSFDETVATVVATFRTMLKLMEEYPEFCFSQSQASVYKIIEDYAPELKEEIQKRIQEGRWEVTASAWVETDKNMPCLESLMNHIVYTKQYFKEKWAVEPDSLDIDFSPDTFGHSAFLPELDALGGVKYYYHCRGLDDINKILYRWRAPSGKELLMYREPYWYNSGIVPETAIGLPRMATLCGGLRTGMAVYGVGDHGGGPTRRDLNRALEMQQWPVFPKLKFARMHDYFAVAEGVREKLPVVEHELNSIFTGCYTTQSRIKKGNRRAELALVNAEKLSALVSRELKGSYEQHAFEKAWQNTLFTHFHDIITGSCVPDSREHAMGLYQEALSIANCRTVQALETLGKAIDTSALLEEDDDFSRSEGAGVGFGLTQGNIPTCESNKGMTRILHIINTTGVERHENASLTIWDWPGDIELMSITDVSGKELPFQRTSGWENYWSHRYFSVMVNVTVPAYGYTTVVLREKDSVQVTDSFLRADMWDLYHYPTKDIVLENAHICARFDKRTGELCSLIDKITGKERLRADETGGLRYVRVQRHPMSSWIIDRYLEVEKLTEVVKVEPFAGNLCSGLVAEYKVRNSQVTTKVTLGSEDKFLKVQLHVDWKEDSKNRTEQPLLSYCLPLDDTTGRMLCDVPGGALWRKEKEQDVPCQRYGAAEFADGRIVALASDCKYGFRLSDNDLFVTLINTADHPDFYAEHGLHDVSLFILSSSADAAVLARETDICLNPLQYMTNTSHAGTLPTTGSLLETSGDTVVFTGIAEREGCLAVRMYESAGKDCSVTITLHSPVSEAQLTDLFGRKLDIPVTVKDRVMSFTLKSYNQAELRIANAGGVE